MLNLYVPAVYVLATIVVCIIGFQQGSWLDKKNCNPNILRFRKPVFYRLGSAMMAILFLQFVLFFVSGIEYFGKTITWFFLVPLCLLFSWLFVYTAGPEDLFINIETQVCQQTKGWFFHPRKRSISLSEASCVCIVAGSKSYYINLMIGGNTDLWFLIARPSNMSDATTIAQEIAGKLHLLVKESSFDDLRKLS